MAKTDRRERFYTIAELRRRIRCLEMPWDERERIMAEIEKILPASFTRAQLDMALELVVKQWASGMSCCGD